MRLPVPSVNYNPSPRARTLSWASTHSAARASVYTQTLGVMQGIESALTAPIHVLLLGRGRLSAAGARACRHVHTHTDTHSPRLCTYSTGHVYSVISFLALPVKS